MLLCIYEQAREAFNEELNFEISADDMAVLLATAPLSDYGAQNFFPIFNKARA